MPDEEERVHTDSVLLPGGQLRGDLRTAAPVHSQRHARNPLEEKGARVAPVVAAQLRMRVHVDEPRRHDEPRHIHRVQRHNAGSRGVPHEHDTVARYGDIGAGRLGPRAIQHGPARQQQVGGLAVARTGREQEKEEGRHQPTAAHRGLGFPRLARMGVQNRARHDRRAEHLTADPPRVVWSATGVRGSPGFEQR